MKEETKARLQEIGEAAAARSGPVDEAEIRDAVKAHRTDPAPDTTLSAEDAEVLADEMWGIYRGEREERLERIVRDLDTKNAALAKRLRVAEERLRELDDYKRALAHLGPETVITMQASDPAPCGILPGIPE